VEKMKNWFQSFLLLFLAVLFSGCAHVISKDLREKADTPLTFQQVLQDPNAYIDKYALWGGEIIQTINQKDGTTLIEVFQRPLGSGEEPKLTQPSEGRFLALAEKYLDPYLFRRGRKVTVAGKICERR
jgi:outer membrane lipoprotein